MPPVVGAPGHLCRCCVVSFWPNRQSVALPPCWAGFPAKGALKLRKRRISRKMGFSFGVFIMLAREGGLVGRCYARPP